MLTQPVTDPRAWNGARLDDRSSWYYPLSPRLLAALEETIRGRRPSQPATSLVVSDAARKAGAEFVGPVLEALERCADPHSCGRDEPDTRTRREDRIGQSRGDEQRESECEQAGHAAIIAPRTRRSHRRR